jgi:DNA phosphorothioation-dependent restriction protein DptF
VEVPIWTVCSQQHCTALYIFIVAFSYTILQSAGSGVNDYLYVETAIERDFHQALEHGNMPAAILFLCGSSGDGKSEILTRYYERYNGRFQFHLDATHSFRPEQNAIQTLDDVFTAHKQTGTPLVVGINIGMLGNYAEDGSTAHADIIEAIRAFLHGTALAPQYRFLNFEDYPKFEPADTTFVSPFLSAIVQKLTAATAANPFYAAYQHDGGANNDGRLYTNFRLLQHPDVQAVILQTLLKAQLRYDQFLTTRTILDFLRHLLTGPGYLFDNLFSGQSSDLHTALTHFDPCTLRSRTIDLFLLHYSLGIAEPEFTAFQHALHQWLPLEPLTPGSWLRLLYLLQRIPIGNNYHQRFRNDFRNDVIEAYLAVWLLHQRYDGRQEQRRQLCIFYRKLIDALFRFANRFAPELSNHGLLFLDNYSGYVLAARAEITESLRRIADHRPQRLGHFSACLRLDNDDLPPIPISANFLELLLKINTGYRPNKHDKNTIVILEEVLSHITRRVRASHQLHISKGRDSWVLRHDEDEGEIVVER